MRKKFVVFLSLDKRWINRKQIFFMLAISYLSHVYLHNMAYIFVVSHILLLFHSPKGSWNKSAKYEKLGKYRPYCTRNRAITDAYLIKLIFIILMIIFLLLVVISKTYLENLQIKNSDIPFDRILRSCNDF